MATWEAEGDHPSLTPQRLQIQVDDKSPCRTLAGNGHLGSWLRPYRRQLGESRLTTVGTRKSASQLKYRARNRPVEAIRACPPVKPQTHSRARAPRCQPKPDHAKRARSGVIYPVWGRPEPTAPAVSIPGSQRLSPHETAVRSSRHQAAFTNSAGCPSYTRTQRLVFPSHTGATMALQCSGSLPTTGARS
jgi:hypothetical protein